MLNLAQRLLILNFTAIHTSSSVSIAVFLSSVTPVHSSKFLTVSDYHPRSVPPRRETRVTHTPQGRDRGERLGGRVDEHGTGEDVEGRQHAAGNTAVPRDRPS